MEKSNGKNLESEAKAETERQEKPVGVNPGRIDPARPDENGIAHSRWLSNPEKGAQRTRAQHRRDA
jgi:hypothetical protein